MEEWRRVEQEEGGRCWEAHVLSLGGIGEDMHVGSPSLEVMHHNDCISPHTSCTVSVQQHQPLGWEYVWLCSHSLRSSIL